MRLVWVYLRIDDVDVVELSVGRPIANGRCRIVIGAVAESSTVSYCDRVACVGTSVGSLAIDGQLCLTSWDVDLFCVGTSLDVNGLRCGGGRAQSLDRSL